MSIVLGHVSVKIVSTANLSNALIICQTAYGPEMYNIVPALIINEWLLLLCRMLLFTTALAKASCCSFGLVARLGDHGYRA